jgi:ribosomal protein S18 acetylase RimI-like enzyme
MKPAPFRIEPLNIADAGAHDRRPFHCGEEALDRYFQTQSTQDIRRRVANCFVAVEIVTGQVAAFYTLSIQSMSAASIPFVDLPPEESKRLPRYPTLPAVRIGRLAVDERFQGRGLGEALLMNAVERTMRADAAAFTLLVDAKNERAAAFYRRYGFRALQDHPRTLFLPLATARKAFL